MDKSKIFKHFAIIGSGTLVNMFVGLITTPLITRLVAPIEYGRLSIFNMYSSIAVMILCLGLDQALVRFYYEHEDNNGRQALLFKCIKFPIILSIVISICIIVASAFNIIQFEFDSFVVILLCVFNLSEVLYRFCFILLRLEYKSKLLSTVNVIKKISYVSLAVPLLFFLDGNDLYILVISTVFSSIVCLVMSIVWQKEIWNFKNLNEKKCVISMKELLKYAYPYIISMGITTLFQAIDKISLNRYCTYYEVGIYSSTMTLVHIMGIVQTTFNSLWHPMAVEHYTKNPNDRSFYKKGNQVITVIMFFFGLSVILVKDVFSLLLGEKYREAAFILPFLIFNPIMYTVSETTVMGIVFKKKSKMQVVVATGACITNIVGNTILVPRLGCQGAAISTGISYIVFFLLRTFISNKYFYINFNLGKFLIITMMTILYALYNSFHMFSFVNVIAYLICVVILVVLYKDTVFYLLRESIGLLKKKK